MNFELDKQATIANRIKISKNLNLQYWYKKTYQKIFDSIDNLEEKNILEVGAGASPIKNFYPNVKTSDILNLDCIDYVFDCHDLDSFHHIQNQSLDMILAVNVLHHIKNPIKFINAARAKLKQTGSIVFVDPYFSALSSVIYRYLHYEPVDFSISEPILSDISGPLTSANQAIPYMMFFSNRGWLLSLNGYNIENIPIVFHGGLSYMITGGVSKKIPINHSLYKTLYFFDGLLAKFAPNIFCSFFIARLSLK